MALVSLAGCTTPVMWGAPGATVEVGDSRYLVRWTDQRAEAVRLTAEARADRRIALLKAKLAIEAASGCRVLDGTLYGDWTLAEAWLGCPGHAPPRLKPVLTVTPR